MANGLNHSNILNTSRIWEMVTRRNATSQADLPIYKQPVSLLLSKIQSSKFELLPEVIQEFENVTCICHSLKDVIIGGCPSGLLIIWRNGIRAMHYYCKSAINTLIHGKFHNKVFAGTEKGEIIRWAYSSTDNSVVELIGHKQGVTCLVLLEEDKMLISGGKDNKILFWLLTGRRKPTELNEHTTTITSLKVNDEENKLFSSSLDGIIIVWNIENIMGIHVIHKLINNYSIEHIELCGTSLISADSKGIIVKWSLEDYSKLYSYQFPSRITSMCKSNDSRYLYLILLSKIDFSIQVITIEKIETEKIFSIPSAHTSTINAICPIPNSTRILTSSNDKSLKIWDFNEKYDLTLLVNRNTDINCITVNEELNLIVTGDCDGQIELFNLEGKKRERQMASVKCQINTLIVTKDNSHIVAACEDEKIRVWKARATSQVPWNTFEGHSESVVNLASGADGRFLFSSSTDKTVKVWDFLYETVHKSLESNRNEDNSKKTEVIGHKNDVNDVKVTNNYIFSGSSDGFVIVWSLRTFEQLKKLEFGATVFSVGPSELENCVAACGKSKNIKIWWDFLRTPMTTEVPGHLDDVTKLFVYGASNLMYSISKDLTVKIWSLDQSLVIFSLKLEDLCDFHVPESQKSIYLLTNKDRKLSCVKELKNPIFANEIVVYPPDYAYFYKGYMKKVQFHETNVYDEFWQQYIVFPHSINLSYVFIYANRPNLLKFGLANGLRFLKNKNHESPLSWAISRNNNQCADVILKNLSKIQLKNERVVIESIEKEMNRLISYNLSRLPMLFEGLFETLTENVEATGRLKKSAPMIMAHKERILNQEEYFDRVQSAYKKEFLEFRMSLCRFHFSIGSLESLNLLNSITDCHNPEFFKTQLLKALLTYKWRESFYILIIETLIYCTSLVFLTLYIISDHRHEESFNLIVLLCFISVNLLQNCIKGYHSCYKFLKNPWNILDLTRITLGYFYIIKQLAFSNQDFAGLELLTMFYWLKAISYFRIFNRYRYLLRVIMETVKDMYPFFLILFTSTIAFAMLLLVSQQNMDFYSAFVTVYLLDQTNFLIELNSFENILVFFLASLLNPIIMLNLLIAIMGDTYDRVQEDQNVADYQEMTDLILEAEYLVFWNRRSVDKFSYITRCDYARNLNKEKDEWMGKIRAVKKSLQGLEGKFKVTSRNIDLVQVNLLEKLNEIASTSSSLNRRLKDVMNTSG